MKNLTLLSSLLGTWSTWTHLSARIPGLGHYEVMAYFVVHFVPDPTRQNACNNPLDETDMDNNNNTCSEWDNMYCQNTHEELKHAQPKCFNMTDPHVVSDWSDVSAYYNIGIQMSAGFPFNFDNEHRETGDSWIGPYSIILAQQQPSATDDDTYAIRYVRTFSTPHLQRYPVNQTLFPFEGYIQSFGPEAVTATLQQQATLQHGQDPFVQQHATCQHGNITPILPLYQFSKKKKKRTMTKSSLLTDNNDDDNDDNDWDIQVDYRALISPSTENLAYKWMPWIQKQVNKRGLGFTVDGPYCYFDDPNRAWTVSVSMDTMMTDEYNSDSFYLNANHDSTISSLTTLRRKQQQQQALSVSGRVLNVVHACVEGLPCIPPNVMSTFNNHINGSSSSSPSYHGLVPNEALDLDTSGLVVWCIMSVVVLLVATIFSCTCWICQRRRHKQVVNSLLQRELARRALRVRNADNDMMIAILPDDDADADANGDDDGHDHDNNDPTNNAPTQTNETLPFDEGIVDDVLRGGDEKSTSILDDPVLSQPLLPSQGTATTASSEQKNKKPVASISATAATTIATNTSNKPQVAVDKRQGEEIV